MPYKDPTKRRLHEIWRHMLYRCENSVHQAYKDYGGRGISVCDEWHSFKVFYEWAITSGYKSNLTLDRKLVNGNYEPGNCKWSTWEEQGNNRRTNVHITLNGVTKTEAEWAKYIGISRQCLYQRLKNGWPIERALKT